MGEKAPVQAARMHLDEMRHGLLRGRQGKIMLKGRRSRSPIEAGRTKLGHRHGLYQHFTLVPN